MTFQNSAAPNILVVTASASLTSRSERLGHHILSLLEQHYGNSHVMSLRTLPPAPLLQADVADKEIARAVEAVSGADAIVVVTPTYKGSYSGLLKTFFDLLPQYALRGKIILPVATGGTIAHVQMLDHALRPVLQTMWPRHIAQGCFILDQHIVVAEDGSVTLAENCQPLLLEVIEQFETVLAALGRSAPLAAG